MRKSTLKLAVILVSMGVLPYVGKADVADFYRGKSMSLIVGTASGNDYDYRARLVSRHLSRFIPGAPTVIVQNMPGAGGIVAANYLASVAAKDGTILLAPLQNIPTLQALKSTGINYDVRKFNWIGSTDDSANAIVAWHTSGVKNIEDVKNKELIVGAAMGNASIYYMAALNALVGTKFKVVTGYPGGNAINLALERGEVAGRSNSFSGYYSTKRDWIEGNKVNFLVQVGLRSDHRHPNVPLLVDLAQNDQDRKVLEFISSDVSISRPLTTAPDVPADRVGALRAAFMSVVKDPEFLVEAAKQSMEISPSSGEETQKIVEAIVNASPDVIERARQIIQGSTKQ
jgi:tripartite-type tricarboxylate transporter receptor subunit TctC